MAGGVQDESVWESRSRPHIVLNRQRSAMAGPPRRWWEAVTRGNALSGSAAYLRSFMAIYGEKRRRWLAHSLLGGVGLSKHRGRVVGCDNGGRGVGRNGVSDLLYLIRFGSG